MTECGCAFMCWRWMVENTALCLHSDTFRKGRGGESVRKTICATFRLCKLKWLHLLASTHARSRAHQHANRSAWGEVAVLVSRLRNSFSRQWTTRSLCGCVWLGFQWKGPLNVLCDVQVSCPSSYFLFFIFSKSHTIYIYIQTFIQTALTSFKSNSFLFFPPW